MSRRRGLLALGSAAVVAGWCGACTSILGNFSLGSETRDAATGSADSTTLEGSSTRTDSASDAPFDSGSYESGACTSACVTAISANGHHTCATLSDQTLRCWGSDTYGECGPNSDGGRTPQTVPGLGPVHYARAGDTATCALLVDGSVWCWGDDSRGTLGTADAGGVAPDGAPVGSPTPLQVVGPGTAAFLGVGAYHACLLTTASQPQLMCWGFNNFGQAGVSGASSVFSPTVVPTTNAITLTLGAFETCFLRSDSPVGECIGDNVYGELGQGIASDAGDGGDASDASGSGTDNLPHPVPATVDVGSLGLISTFAHSTGNQMGVVLKSGQIATWGQDNEGQLGLLDDSGTSLPTPTLVPSFDEVTDMSFMQYGACALRVDGTVWCWGSTAYGETGSTANSGPVQYTPAQVQGLSNVTAITAGLDHVCALIDGGTVDCWGWNTDGALGRATSAVFDPTPAPVEF